MNAVLERVHELEAAVESQTIDVLLRQITREAKDINSYEFVSANGEELPPFSAGAHIDVHIGPGLIRQYSLCNDPQERHRYVIAVLKDEQGKGGSNQLHNTFKVQDVIKISKPRNNFVLNQGSAHTILIAGGIGITPLKSMAHELARSGQSFELHYCTRTHDTTAFHNELSAWKETGCLQVHWDNGQPGQGLNLGQLLMDIPLGAHVYYCGPQGFMQACEQAASHWPQGTVHFEHFKAPVIENKGAPLEKGEYMVRIASTGQLIPVRSDQPLTESLQEAGVSIPTSCVSGLCGTCKVRYLEGEVEHQDYILSPEEQKQEMTACVSHTKTDLLVLDL